MGVRASSLGNASWSASGDLRLVGEAIVKGVLIAIREQRAN